ncbi:hypothetical protein PR048_019174 [Dryococelus australis]|uniref:Amino acid transporter transmembrane domain-containing protein n=1 Tax=Dryococelus australis TaxID=614101 RepID=A0ABQ9H2S0_9NEOP|nr:hypothetical protein PR048_019174 [Dryococelus australis]
MPSICVKGDSRLSAIGPLGITFSAVGTLLAGAAITKFRPSARILAFWNVVVVVISAVCIASYAFLGCQVGDSYGATDHTGL